jgi:hypothetical protein
MSASLVTPGEAHACTSDPAWRHAHRSVAGSPIRPGASASLHSTRVTLPSTSGTRSPCTTLAMAAAV